MAKLVDALDLGSCGATRKSSNLFTCTKNKYARGDYDATRRAVARQPQPNW